MSLHTTIPKVTILQQPNLMLALDAWMHSRPNETNVDLKKVLAIDVPVNEFPRVTAQFYAPILVREIVCTLRDHVVWARTSRVDDLTRWEVHPLAMTAATGELFTQMMQLRGQSADQDDFRFKLPLGYMTHFSVDLSLRTWLNLANYFGHLAQRGSNGIVELWAQMHNQMLATLEPEWLRGLRYKHRELFPKIRLAGKSERVGAMVFAEATVPLALRAQVVRHRMFMVTDELYSFFNARSLSLPISTRMFMQVAAPLETARAIVSKRQCWIAQSDIWEPLIQQMNVALDASGVPVLPCDDDGICPYRRDNELRIEGKDPNVPCPRFAHLYSTRMSEADRERARQYAAKRATAKFWHEEIKLEEETNG